MQLHLFSFQSSLNYFKNFVILLGIFLISPIIVNAQSIDFEEVIGTSFVGVSVGDISFADIDNDGDQDFLLTGEDNNEETVTKLYANDGTGSFTEIANIPFDPVKFSRTEFMDIDNDGDQDLLLTGENSAFEAITKLYINDGTGNFTEVIDTPFVGVSRATINFADVDGDGDPDVLITGQIAPLQGVTKLYINDGTGAYSLDSGTSFEDVALSSVAFADVDGDGDQDFVLTGLNSTFTGTTNLYVNDGSGNFSLSTESPFIPIYLGSIAFADIDGDNDPDLLITGQDPDTQRISVLYSNDGAGNFSEVTGTNFEGAQFSTTTFVDADEDGDQDVIITGQNNAGPVFTSFYANDGTGTFSEINNLPFENLGFAAVQFSDLDGDGDQDVILAGQRDGVKTTKLYKNNLITCPAPENFTILNITDTTAEFSWDAIGNTVIGYILSVFNEGDDPDVDTPIYTEYLPAGITTGTATNLIGSSNYDAYISADCDADGFSSRLKITFETEMTTPICGDTFFDTGGSNGSYQNNEDYSFLISPETSENIVSLDFTFVDIESNDFLRIYNGIDTMAPELTGADGVRSPGIFTADNPDGSLFVTFVSNATLTGEGWEANVVCTTLGVDEFSNAGLVLYPNPSGTNVFLNSQEVIDNIELYNSLGQRVFMQKPKSQYVTLNVSDLSQGLYFIQITIDGKTFSEKLIKE
ncbi:FG-GAP-like repeat-containing protein [Aequorivita xiaoshiensis]|uniref:FG-GAP-like repeat-containing protein n=1 Tax=Aequorivita xiaoshiensis TaxID=2874476 RepID=A0A9X1R600_9FLAO|nr:FG-GAP-like repeat-containing protein [Aequorivita xiaoshiensis]MCG2431634.1 FG-GAP-like repeat-containing protein [Aequorivita xiaoshiensis]